MTDSSSISRRQALAALGAVTTGVGGYVAGVHTADAAPEWLLDDGGCSSASLMTSETDWPLPDHDRGGTRYVPARAGPDPPLELAWAFEWPALLDLPVVELVVADGVAVALLPDPTGGAVVAVSLADGRERWSRQVEDAEFGQVLAAGGIAFVEAEVPEADAQFTAHALADGTALWRNSLATHAPRALARGRLLSFERNPDRSRGETHFAATAVDARTGEECWRTVHPGWPFDAATADGRVLVTTGDGVLALDPSSGERQWRSDPDCGASAVAGGRLFSGGDALRACSLEDGSLEWQVRSEYGFEVGALTPTSVVARLGDADASADRLQARERASGDLLWELGPDPEQVESQSYAAPTAVGDEVLVVDRRRRGDAEANSTALVRLDAATGTERDRKRFADESVFAPVVDGGLLLVPTRERLVAYA